VTFPFFCLSCGKPKTKAENGSLPVLSSKPLSNYWRVQASYADDPCPAADGVVCGKSKAYVGSGEEILSMNQGTCHVWKEKDGYYACRSEASISQSKTRTLAMLNCSKDVKSAYNCENAIKSGLSDLKFIGTQGCQVSQLDCAMDSALDLYHCTAKSNICMDIIETSPDHWGCPAGYELKENDNFVKYMATAQLIWIGGVHGTQLNKLKAKHGVSVCHVISQSNGATTPSTQSLAAPAH
jgi:hypothetical protein